MRNRVWLFSTRWRARWRFFANSGDALNRRLAVDNELLAAAKSGSGIDPERCRELAYKLGVSSR